MKDKNKLILSIIIILSIMILTILGTIGYFNNRKYRKSNNEENTENIISTSEAYQGYIKNLYLNMQAYIKNNGYFESFYYPETPYVSANYKISDDLKLYLTVRYKNTDGKTIYYKDKYIDDNILEAEFYHCEDENYICLKYLKYDGTVYNLSNINYDNVNEYNSLQKEKTSLKNIVTFFPECCEINIFGYSNINDNGLQDKIIDNIEDEYIKYLKNLYESFFEVNKTLGSKQEIKQYDIVTKSTFSINKLDFDNMILKQNDSKIIDKEVLLFKVLYNNNIPILYYWKSDGYWYRYDYYNKEEPITTKIDLDYIIDVRQFTYDTGETITLFVDIEGNLKEFTE